MAAKAASNNIAKLEVGNASSRLAVAAPIADALLFEPAAALAPAEIAALEIDAPMALGLPLKAMASTLSPAEAESAVWVWMAALAELAAPSSAVLTTNIPTIEVLLFIAVWRSQ